MSKTSVRRRSAGTAVRTAPVVPFPVRFNAAWVVLLVVCAVVLFVRLRLAATPFERDEGEFAYMGQLLLRGVPPYQLAYNMKLPGTYLAYALIMAVAGSSVQAIHAGFAVVNLATILVAFLLTRRLADDWAAMMAAGAYGVMSMLPSVLGSSAHATHFIVLPGLAGLLVLARGLDDDRANEEPAGGVRTRRSAWSRLWPFPVAGLLVGTAFLMKQPGAFFVLVALAWVALAGRRNAREAAVRAALILLGAVVPFALTCLWLWRAGVFGTFWFWVFSYAEAYGGSAQTILPAFQVSSSLVVADAPIVWMLAAAGAIAVFLNRPLRRPGLAVMTLLMLSFAGVAAGFHFRRHYFVMLLPAAAMLAGLGTTAMLRALHARRGAGALRVAGVVLTAAAVAQPLVADREFLFDLSPEAACIALYGGNPFPESVVVAGYVKSHSNADDRVVVLGSEPQIYFYADRASGTGYIYTYPLMESQPFAATMQREMIKEVENSKPRFLVFVPAEVSWLRSPSSVPDIFGWIDRYVPQNYHLVGMAELGRTDAFASTTTYYWDDDARDRRPTSSDVVMVFERNPG